MIVPKDKKGKNYNSTGKELFVLYECPNCGRNDASMVPPFMNVNLPYFIQCGCGGYVMYQRAWITEPYRNNEVWMGWLTGDKKILTALKKELKEVTHILSPEGTMADANVMMQDPEFLKKIEAKMKEEENKKAMYR